MRQTRLEEWAAARGYGLAVSGLGVVDTVREKLFGRRDAGSIDPGFFEKNLGGFRHLDGSVDAGSGCAVMVAVPSPIHVLPVTIGGERIETFIPPTYLHYNETFANVLADMNKNALGPDERAEVLKAPLKSLAAHMGLVAYGRNNITYIEGLGSGFQLCGYIVWTDRGTSGVACADADGRERALERCSTCRACVRVCPTGAIHDDRFLISAERCYTLHSESRDPMPAWIKRPKSVCLIGCLDCQEVCPENKGRLNAVPSGIEFTAEETEAVLEAGRRIDLRRVSAESADLSEAPAGIPNSLAWASARAKFDGLGMSEDLEIMGRNLALFLE